MRRLSICCVCLMFLCGCSSFAARRRENPSSYARLSPAERELVQHGQLERGMDANAVYLAWGKPSAVIAAPSPSGSGTEETWFYYGDRPVLVPAWDYFPDPYGYWSPRYTPLHYSQRYTKAEVHFYKGRVAGWRRN